MKAEVEMSLFKVSGCIINCILMLYCCMQYVVLMCVPPPDPSPVVAVSCLAKSVLVSGSSLSLTCSIQPLGGGSVDTAATIMSSWDAPDSMYGGQNTANATSVPLDIASVQTADTGVYTCSVSVTDSTGSIYVRSR